MASSVTVSITEHVTTATMVTSMANIVTSCYPHTAVILSPQQRGPKTRSSSGTSVRSTHMRVRVSPDKSPLFTVEASTSPSPAEDSGPSSTPEMSPSLEGNQLPSPSHFPLPPSPAEDSGPSSIPEMLPSLEGNLSPSYSQSSFDQSSDVTSHSAIIAGPPLDLNLVAKGLDSLEAQINAQKLYNLLQNDHILKLESRIENLEGTLIQNNAKLTVRDHVIQALRGEVNRLQQFTRRYCVTVAGIQKERGENAATLRQKVTNLVTEVNSDTKVEDIDKFHRNGRITNGNEQEIIIRFRSHAAKEQFYKARKNLPPTRKEVKIRPSLSRNQKSLLKEAQTFVEESNLKNEDLYANPVEFVLANVHGDIQVKLKEKFKGNHFITFNSIQELTRRLQEAQGIENAENSFDEIYSWAEVNPNPTQSGHFRIQVGEDEMGFGNLF